MSARALIFYMNIPCDDILSFDLDIWPIKRNWHRSLLLKDKILKSSIGLRWNWPLSGALCFTNRHTSILNFLLKNYLPFGRGSWNLQFLVSFPYRCYMYITNLVKIGSVFLEKNMWTDDARLWTPTHSNRSPEWLRSLKTSINIIILVCNYPLWERERERERERESFRLMSFIPGKRCRFQKYLWIPKDYESIPTSIKIGMIQIFIRAMIRKYEHGAVYTYVDSPTIDQVSMIVFVIIDTHFKYWILSYILYCT